MTLIDRGCWERGCACHDDRDKFDTVEVVLRNDVLEKPVAWLCRRKTGGSLFVYTEEQLYELGYGNISVPPFDKVAPLYTTPPLRNDVLEKPVGRFAKFTDGIWREVTDGSAGVSLYTTPPLRNDVLEEVAKEFDKMKAFGDTAASFAAFVRNMKR